MESAYRACRAMLDDHLVKLRPEHSQTTVSFSHCRSCSEALTSDNAKQQRFELEDQGRESQRSLGKLATDLGSKKSSCLQCKRSCQTYQIIKSKSRNIVPTWSNKSANQNEMSWNIVSTALRLENLNTHSQAVRGSQVFSELRRVLTVVGLNVKSRAWYIGTLRYASLCIIMH